jgi:hypothetical protein
MRVQRLSLEQLKNDCNDYSDYRMCKPRAGALLGGKHHRLFFKRSSKRSKASGHDGDDLARGCLPFSRKDIGPLSDSGQAHFAVLSRGAGYAVIAGVTAERTFASRRTGAGSHRIQRDSGIGTDAERPHSLVDSAALGIAPRATLAARAAISAIGNPLIMTGVMVQPAGAAGSPIAALAAGASVGGG